jgi:PAS domain S-box-containing protein
MSQGHGDVDKAALLLPEEREQSVVITDPALPDNPVIFVSDEFEKQTGYTAQDVLGRNCRFLQGPDTDPGAVEAIRAAVANETEITVDILNYRKDGTEFWNRLRIRPLREEGGATMYFVGAQNPVDVNEARGLPIGSIED